MLKRKKQIIAKVMATTMLASTLATTFTSTVNAAEPRSTVSETSIAGGDRYKTAVEISKNYTSTSKHAVIVNGEKGIVDALTATPYASLKKAPILMTQSTTLNSDTKAELTRRGIKTVDIVGGTKSVDDKVKAEIEAMGITVNRIAGIDKYDTALKVAKEIDAISDISKIAVANGEVLADAVSVAAPAAQNKMPIILVHPTNGLDANTKTYINGENISTSYVIGGTTSVSDTIKNTLPGTKERLSGGAGTGRQETNAAVVKKFYTSSTYDNIYVAKSGQVNKADEIADALAVGVLAASNQDPVMLVGNSLVSAQKTLLEGKEIEKITKVGNGIPTASINAIKETQNSTKTVTTVAELKTALANAKDGQTINFSPSGTVSEDITLSTTKTITVNLNGNHSGSVSVNMPNGTLNINGNISKNISRSVSNKVSVDAVKAINIKSGVTVKHLEIKSGAKNSNISNNGTVTTFDVLATGVKITGSGKISELNPQGDTDYSGFKGEISNLDSSKPISQVVIQNAKELVIRFNKPVDKASLVKNDGKLSNCVNITSAPGENSGLEITRDDCSASLSSNGTTLTITAPEGQYFKGKYTLTVDRVTSGAITLDRYTTIITADDKVSPEVSSIEFNQDYNQFEINLTEPVDNITDLVLRMNNTSYEGKVEAVSTNTKKLILKRANTSIALGDSVDIYIAGIKDRAGNLIKPYSNRMTVNKQDLTITSVKQVANNKIRVVFNKKLSATPYESTILPGATATGSDTKGLKVYKSTTAPNNVNMITSITPVPSDITGRSYDLTINHDFGTTTYQTVYIALDENACTDNTGVLNKVYSTSLSLNNDKTKPTMLSVALSANKDAIEVTMSEAITGLVNSKVSIRKNSVPIGNVTATLKPGTENVIVVKTSDSTHGVDSKGMLKAGKYQVYFDAEAFTDLSGNKVDGFNTGEVTVTAQATVEEPLELNIVETSNDNEYEINIIDDTENPLDVKDKTFEYNSLSTINFTVDGKSIPTNSNVRFKDHTYQTVVVTLPDEYVSFTGKAILGVKGLEVQSDRAINSTEKTVDVKDNKAPTLEKVQLITVKNANTTTKDIVKYELKLTFDEHIALLSSVNGTNKDISALLADVEIMSGSTKYNGFKDEGTYDVASYAVDGKVVTITILKNDIKDIANWNAVFGSYSTSFEIKNDMNIVRDTDSVLKNYQKIKAKKGIKLYIEKKIEERTI